MAIIIYYSILKGYDRVIPDSWSGQSMRRIYDSQCWVGELASSSQSLFSKDSWELRILSDLVLFFQIEHRAQHLSESHACLCKVLGSCSHNYWSCNKEDPCVSLWGWCDVQHSPLSFPRTCLLLLSCASSCLFFSRKWGRERGWAPIMHGKMNLPTIKTSTVAKAQEPCH